MQALIQLKSTWQARSAVIEILLVIQGAFIKQAIQVV